MHLSPRDFARSLRNNATPEEHALWTILSRIRPRFTRQLRSDPFVGDFACRRAKLLVEVDGSQHAESRSDDFRTELLGRQHWRLICIWNSDIRGNLDGVSQMICVALQARIPEDEIVEFVASRAGRERRPRSRQKKGHP